MQPHASKLCYGLPTCLNCEAVLGLAHKCVTIGVSSNGYLARSEAFILCPKAKGQGFRAVRIGDCF